MPTPRAPAERRDRSSHAVLYELHRGDCIAWMHEASPSSIHDIVTDPPYGTKEHSEEEKRKLQRRHGVWRIPPSFDAAGGQAPDRSRRTAGNASPE